MYGLAKGRGGQGQSWTGLSAPQAWASSTSSQLLTQLCQVLEKWEGSQEAQCKSLSEIVQNDQPRSDHPTPTTWPFHLNLSPPPHSLPLRQSI